MSRPYRSGSLPGSVADAVVIEVAARTGVNARDIRGKHLNRYIIPARHEVFWTLRQITHPDGTPKYSFPAIAAVFDMDHTSVMFGCRQHEKRLAAAEAQAA